MNNTLYHRGPDDSGVEMTNSSQKSFQAKAGVITDLGEVKIVINPSLRFDGTDVWFDIGLPKGMEKYVDSVEGWLAPNGQISSAYRTAYNRLPVPRNFMYQL